MTRRDRLMNTLQGKPVDRPPVNFYEINGLDQDEGDASPFNIYSDPSWRPLLELTRERTDRVPRRSLPAAPAPDCPLTALTKKRSWLEGGSEFTRIEIPCHGRTFTTLTRRDPDVNTTWTLAHPLKDADDLAAYLTLPMPRFDPAPDLSPILLAEKALGDTGIVMIDMGDPLCRAASLFSMEDYLVVALTERALFRKLLDRFEEILLPLVERTAKALPGRLWRVVGAEYAGAPYLPPELFRDYVTVYDHKIVEAIQRHGGHARIHCHGNLAGVLDLIAETGCTGLDPVEPPPQGDVDLAYVRERAGKQMVLWGNLEASDLEMLSAAAFSERIRRALDQGAAGEGRGFVLMPSACPYGRKLSLTALKNYEMMVEIGCRN